MEDERFGFFLPSMPDYLSWCLSYAKSNLCTVTDTVGWICIMFLNDIFKLANKRRVVWCSIGPPLMMLRWCISPGWPEVLLCLPAQRDTMRHVSRKSTAAALQNGLQQVTLCLFLPKPATFMEFCFWQTAGRPGVLKCGCCRGNSGHLTDMRESGDDWEAVAGASQFRMRLRPGSPVHQAWI